mmetsp:Transcript_8557/g.25617  ORF Transcript_8557/g.25617 Transcript_8557/m.25617 type:complete len:329 (-) Transcript_8557:342-1328(-)
MAMCSRRALSKSRVACWAASSLVWVAWECFSTSCACLRASALAASDFSQWSSDDSRSLMGPPPPVRWYSLDSLTLLDSSVVVLRVVVCCPSPPAMAELWVSLVVLTSRSFTSLLERSCTSRTPAVPARAPAPMPAARPAFWPVLRPPCCPPVAYSPPCWGPVAYPPCWAPVAPTPVAPTPPTPPFLMLPPCMLLSKRWPVSTPPSRRLPVCWPWASVTPPLCSRPVLPVLSVVSVSLLPRPRRPPRKPPLPPSLSVVVVVVVVSLSLSPLWRRPPTRPPPWCWSASRSVAIVVAVVSLSLSPLWRRPPTRPPPWCLPASWSAVVWSYV